MARADLRQLGEFGLIQRLIRHGPGLAPGHAVLVGPGDDAAVIAIGGGRALALTTDVLVEGVDFERRWCPPRALGAKALAVNLSDLAAIGARPTSYLVTLGLPPDTPLKYIDQLHAGMTQQARRHRLTLLGGDLSASDRVFVAITTLGTVRANRIVRRAGARSGDVLCVTGTLGDARAGLERLQAAGRADRGYLAGRQLEPTARVAAGLALSETRLATAMIDLSDGLTADLVHLCAASAVGACIDEGRLPLARGLMQYARAAGRDPVGYALAGGEDFELLFTVRPERVRELERLARHLKLALTPIGWITPRRNGLTVATIGGHTRTLPAQGYDHFRPPLARARSSSRH